MRQVSEAVLLEAQAQTVVTSWSLPQPAASPALSVVPGLPLLVAARVPHPCRPANR